MLTFKLTLRWFNLEQVVEIFFYVCVVMGGRSRSLMEAPALSTQFASPALWSGWTLGRAIAYILTKGCVGGASTPSTPTKAAGNRRVSLRRLVMRRLPMVAGAGS